MYTANKTNTTTKEVNTMERKVIINDALSIKVLKVTCPIYRQGNAIINGLEEAINNGTLNNLVIESANANTEGNVSEVVKALKKCLASYKVNVKKASGHIDMQIEALRIATLEAWLNSYSTGSAVKNERYGRVDNGKAKWDVTAAEITALVDAAENTLPALEECYKAVNSIYNCIASKLSKELNDAEAMLREYKVRTAGKQVDATKLAALEAKVVLKERIMAASAECTVQKAALRKRIDALKAAAVDTTDKSTSSLLDKVATADGKTVLSKAEAAKLQEMLKAAGFLK